MIKTMVDLLAEKLSKEEFLTLYEIIDGDPPAGPFWDAIGAKAMELAPAEFVLGGRGEEKANEAEERIEEQKK